MINFDVLVTALPSLMKATVITVELTIASAIFGIVFGVLSCMLQLSRIPGGYILSRTYVSLFRGTPLLIQLFAVYFGLPVLGIEVPTFFAAVFAIALNSGAYTTEIFRAAVLNVARGQIEAAESIGMSKLQIWWRVILPQAVVLSLPALTSELTLVMKGTSLASIVTVTELTYTGLLIQARTFTALEILVPVAALYIAFSLVLTRTSHWLESRLAIYHT